MAGRRGTIWEKSKEFEEISCSERIIQIEKRLEFLKKTQAGARKYRAENGLEVVDNLGKIIAWNEEYLKNLRTLNDD